MPKIQNRGGHRQGVKDSRECKDGGRGCREENWVKDEGKSKGSKKTSFFTFRQFGHVIDVAGLLNNVMYHSTTPDYIEPNRGCPLSAVIN
jgi:hypothetical protein